MKKTILLMVSMFLFAIGYSQSITDGLVAYYPMDGNAIDAGPNGLNGTVTNVSSVANVNGVAGKAMNFTNTIGPGGPPPTSYITLPASAALQIPGDETISFWMKVDPGDVAGYNQWIYSYGFCGTTLTYQNYLGGRFNAEYGCGTFADGFGYTTNQWWHVVVSITRPTGIYKIYKNGILILNYTDPGSAYGYEGVPYIGRYSQNILGFRGYMDEFRIYNRVLSQAEVSLLYNDNLAPVINSFSPQTASTGTTVTISGANFTNASAVSFGGVAASSFTVVNSGTITAVVAAGASGNVSVTTPNGTASRAGFIYCTVVTPSVSITANPGNTICSGTSVSFTANPVNGGITPSYQWKKNGNNVGANSNTYADASLNNGDIISCVLTSSQVCASPATATSNSITITVNNVPSAASPSITGNSNVCTGTQNGYSVTAFSGANSYSWTLPPGWAGNSNTTSITATASSTDGNISVTAINSCGPAAPVILAVTIRPQYDMVASAGQGGIIFPSGTTSVCQGNSLGYAITPDPNYHVQTLVVDGVSQIISQSYNFSNIQSAHTISVTFAPDSYTINSSAGVGGVISPNGNSSVLAGGNQSYTIAADDCFSIADVVVDGASQGAVPSYTFTNVTAAHSISASFTQNGPYTITVTAGANGSITPGTGSVNCGDNATYSITPAACHHIVDVVADGVSQGAITSYTFTNVHANHSISATFAINPALVTPGPLSGPINVCPYIGTATPLTFTVPLDPYATGYAWTIPASCTLVSQNMNSITITVGSNFIANANKQVRVTGLSSCGNSTQSIFYLLAQLPGTPQPIVASTTNICPGIGTAIPVTYTIPKVTAATSYIWTAQAGTTVINHTNGPGVNDTTVTVTFSSGFSSSTITVQSVNDCGTSSSRSLMINRNNPTTPGLISGPTNACPYIGSAASYSIASVNNALSYTWTVPSGASGLTGQGAVNISFSYPAGFTNGTVSVTATNGCGTSGTRTLSITTLNPATPSVIDVIQVQACPNRQYSYTLSAMPANATTVQWTVPAAGTLVSGQGTSSIVVSYPSTTVNGNVTAQAVNNCGSSVVRPSTVKLPVCDAPPPPFTKGNSDNLFMRSSATVQNDMELTVFPNPTTDNFKLQVITAGKEPISLRILDIQGRLLKMLTIMAHETVNVGAELKTGAYLIEVRQGKSLKTTRVLKF